MRYLTSSAWKLQIIAWVGTLYLKVVCRSHTKYDVQIHSSRVMPMLLCTGYSTRANIHAAGSCLKRFTIIILIISPMYESKWGFRIIYHFYFPFLRGDASRVCLSFLIQYINHLLSCSPGPLATIRVFSGRD